MSLSALFDAQKEELLQKSFQQIIAFAGDGHLRDNSDAPKELREYLSRLPTKILRRYVEECLADSFSNSGYALQDIVNQLGERLDFDVEYGRYRGTSNHIGFDGIWNLPSDNSIIVEVKTTDAYRIDLNTLANYRKQLIAQNKTTLDDSSILIVVGRQDTGDLEAQIRGSKHAWDIRLVSVESLLRLVELKEEMEDPNLLSRVSQMLMPKEYTRLDEILDMLFFTAEDIRYEDLEIHEDSEPEKSKGKKCTPAAFNEECVEVISIHLSSDFLRKSKATFESPDKKIGLICSVSKAQNRGSNKNLYWFAFHDHKKNYLDKMKQAFVAFGCGSANNIILMQYEIFKKHLDSMNITEKENDYFWHVHIVEESGKYLLTPKSGFDKIQLNDFLIPEQRGEFLK